MSYYEKMASPQLADEFKAEFRRALTKAAAHPEAYPVRERDLLRLNLQRFPYHFLFRVADDVVRVLVVRHHRRRSSLGSERR
ncbi:MAG: type II toxin-antitoxin system RelE/ParE family toxin [Chthoniobacterales bacterium]|nr:type II toxin-antitoxin system RelE/ParE family toxin [Chthoniobacterales bacterium]